MSPAGGPNTEKERRHCLRSFLRQEAGTKQERELRPRKTTEPPVDGPERKKLAMCYMELWICLFFYEFFT